MILKGNLAVDGSVVKAGAVDDDDIYGHSGPASNQQWRRSC